jgi:hypothetical protein
VTIEEQPVPKLPRGRGLKLSGPEMFRIGLTLITLIGVLVLTRPCADAVSGFVTGFDNAGSGEKQMPKPGAVDMPQQYETLTPGMTEAEIKAAMERSRSRNPGEAASGSAAPPNAGGGSAPPSGSTPPGTTTAPPTGKP